jgi:anti-sigma factor RsiW
MAFENDQHIPIDDLSAYADGEALAADERARIEAHLASCHVCQEELQSLRAISTLLSDLPEPELPRSFRLAAADVQSSSAGPSQSEPVPIQPWIVRNQWYFRYAGLAAALLLVVVVSIDLLPGDSEESADLVTMMEDSGDEQALDGEEAAEEPGIMSVDDADEPAMDIEADAPEEFPVEEDADMPEDIEDTAPASVEDSEAALEAESAESDHPVAEPDSEESDHPVAERSPEPADEAPSARLMADDDEGISTLQGIAIGLAVLSVALLLIGFLLPRWWSASAR